MQDLFDHPEIKDIIEKHLLQSNDHALKSKSNRMIYLQQIKEAAQKIKIGAKVLDLGCGAGHVSLILKMKRPDLQITALNYPKKDPTWEDINKKFAINFQIGDGINLNFADETFDAVLAFGVLEHVNDYNGRVTENGEDLFLKEINRIMKKSGFFYICNLPNYYSLNEYFSFKLIKSHHERRFRKKEIKELLKKHQFKVKKVKREYFLPVQWDYLGERISKLTNKFYKFLINLDKIIMFTPLRFFAEGFCCMSKKK